MSQVKRMRKGKWLKSSELMQFNLSNGSTIAYSFNILFNSFIILSIGLIMIISFSFLLSDILTKRWQKYYKHFCFLFSSSSFFKSIQMIDHTHSEFHHMKNAPNGPEWLSIICLYYLLLLFSVHFMFWMILNQFKQCLH